MVWADIGTQTQHLLAGGHRYHISAPEATLAQGLGVEINSGLYLFDLITEMGPARGSPGRTFRRSAMAHLPAGNDLPSFQT